VPSVGYMTNLFIAATQQELLWMISQGGELLKTDHPFGTTDFIRLADHSKAFEAILTVMNESCQVLVQFLTSSKSRAGGPGWPGEAGGGVQSAGPAGVQLQRLLQLYVTGPVVCVVVAVAMQHVPSCDWHTIESYS
jgi:hypothetical protein